MRSERFQEMFETAKNAAFEGGKILKENFGRVIDMKKKAGGSFVTNVDIDSERRILEILKSKYPYHNFFSEESGIEDNNSEYTWVVDPLDGTHNYIQNIPFFAISIGLKYHDGVMFGVIYLPMFNEMFHSIKGNGSFLNDRKIKVSKNREIDKSVVIYSGVFRKKPQHVYGLIDIVKRVKFFRNFGAASIDLCYVACGRVDACVERNVWEYDYIAGKLLVEEANGKVTSISGDCISLDENEIIASNGFIHNEIIGMLKKMI